MWPAGATGRKDEPHRVDQLIYVNAERTFEVIVTETTWTVGSIPARVPLANAANSNPFTEKVGHAVRDCSDTTYQCVQAWSRTLAVPRTGLRPGSVYSKEGVLFSIEECIRGKGARCQVAIVSAKCEERDADGPCRIASSKTHAHLEYVIYFIYNEDFGITAMGVANQVAPTAEGRRMIASQSILISKKGLLKN
jgi:hypothetical protein